MFKKIIFGLCLWLFATTLSFGANLQDGYSAYEKGDYKTAFIIFEDLASKGDAKAQYNLGFMYDNGYGVKQDYKKAIEWWEKAATQGYIDAQNNLGVMYERGQGVKQDYKKA
uniref:tetratricopeptide repeat protein n=1 Tax=Aliarcobacter skirrowii TaxID=28200 RepID=UPI000B2125D2